MQLLAERAANSQDAAIYTVAAFTGLRMGELLALRWRDVDFAKRLVHVRWSHVQGQENRPKSHRVRSVPLIDQAARGEFSDAMRARSLERGSQRRQSPPMAAENRHAAPPSH